MRETWCENMEGRGGGREQLEYPKWRDEKCAFVYSSSYV